MKSLFLVMTGGALGAAARYGMGRALSMGVSGWPWPTFACNIIGGFAMGLLAGWLAKAGAWEPDLRLFIGVGILGGFTTFSAFSLEMAWMVERGQYSLAFAYAVISLLLALAALFAGLWAIRVVLA